MLQAIANYIKKYWYIISIIILTGIYFNTNSFLPKLSETKETQDLILNFILNLISSLFLYSIFQLPTIKKDIDEYFKNALLNPDFLQSIDSNAIKKFNIESLKTKGCDETLADEVVSFLMQEQPILVYDYKETIILTQNMKYEKEITRKYKIKITCDITNKFNNNYSFLEKYLCIKPVHFRKEADEREIQCIISIDNNELHTLNLLINNTKSEIDGFQKKSQIDWTEFQNQNLELASLKIAKGSIINVECKERRRFETLDFFTSYRFPFWTKIIDIEVINKIDNMGIIVNIYGSSIKDKNDFKVKGHPNRVYRKDWIHPGSGYIISLFPKTIENNNKY